MPYYITFRTEPPIVDSAPQDGDDARSIPLALDGRAEETLESLLALESFEVAHLCGALVAAGVRLGERAARRGATG